MICLITANEVSSQELIIQKTSLMHEECVSHFSVVHGLKCQYTMPPFATDKAWIVGTVHNGYSRSTCVQAF